MIGEEDNKENNHCEQSELVLLALIRHTEADCCCEVSCSVLGKR